MNQSKSIIVKAESTKRPTFEQLPPSGSSGWFALYAGYDADVKIIGLNKVHLQVRSTNKKIRYNLQRILRRESGAYSVPAGSGELEPFAKKSTSWTWGPNNLAGLPIVTIQPDDNGTSIRAVMLGQMQLELTNISTQSTEPPRAKSEAMEFNCRVDSLLTGDVNRSEDQGKLYICPIPPPTNDDNLTGDFVNSKDLGVVEASGYIEFPNKHFVIGSHPAYLAYTVGGVHTKVDELDKAGLWGEFFRLPFPILMPFAAEDTGEISNQLHTCSYGRIGRLTKADGQCAEGTYVLVPQPLNCKEPEAVFSVQTFSYAKETFNILASAVLYAANSAFPYEGITPGSTSTDVVVDGVSLVNGKGQGAGYKIHRYVDRQLKTSKSTLIPMPPPSAETLVGGMPFELVTPNGISQMCLIRNSIELRGFWGDLINAIVTVSRVIVDVAEAVGKAGAANEGRYADQYQEAYKTALMKRNAASPLLPDIIARR